MDSSRMRAFSYSGDDQCGDPQGLLRDAVDGLLTAQHVLSDPHALPPPDRALDGLYKLLGGLVETLEGAERLFQARVTDPYMAGFAEGKRVNERPSWNVPPEIRERGKKLDAAAE